MAKVKLCLDAGCTEYILLDDGRCITQRKDKCSLKDIDMDKFESKFKEVADNTREHIFVTGPLFKKVKEGDEIQV